MAKKKSKKKDSKKEKGNNGFNIFKQLQEETTQSVIGIVFLACSIFFLLAALGKAGLAGEKLYGLSTNLLGVGYYLLPFLFLLLGIAFLHSLKKELAWAQIIGGIVFFFAGLGLIDILFQNNGGIVGGALSGPLVMLFDVYASIVFLGAAILIAVLVMFDTSPQLPLQRFMGLFKKPEVQPAGDDVAAAIAQTGAEVNEQASDNASAEPAPEHQQQEDEEPKQTSWFGSSSKKKRSPGDEATAFQPTFAAHGEPYSAPPLSLLERDRGKPGVGDVKADANIIKRTLQNFGIDVEMDEISIGPSVTRYALKPAEGVKLSRIVGLQNDLALALAAHPLRIEAPIPGKSLVGIEIPNQKKTTVGLGTLLGSDDYQKSDKPLLTALGKGISGTNHYGNLAKMPHILIAGATGSGKSVTIHNLVVSLLYRNSPETLKFIMCDPKRVELTLYNDIPHLLSPVITSSKNAILALKWLTKEMDRRYDILEAEKVRDISSYHANVVEPALKKQEKKSSKKKKDDESSSTSAPDDAEASEDEIETMPYIVVIIDELADIMQTYPREMEAAVVRLAQMSRAVGIHLVLSTQRPSVNVITGLIKANIPARIALQVASQIDSRTILDAGGAEKLLGAGDMLYLSGEMGKPQRIQSAFVSEDEVKNVVKHLKENHDGHIGDQIDFSSQEQERGGSMVDALMGKDDEDDEDDDMLEDAREIVIQTQKASTSYIQRKLRVGYARAARLMDMLEERGVVGPSEGSKGREVLVGKEGHGSEAEVSDETGGDNYL